MGQHNHWPTLARLFQLLKREILWKKKKDINLSDAKKQLISHMHMRILLFKPLLKIYKLVPLMVQGENFIFNACDLKQNFALLSEFLLMKVVQFHLVRPLANVLHLSTEKVVSTWDTEPSKVHIHFWWYRKQSST